MALLSQGISLQIEQTNLIAVCINFKKYKYIWKMLWCRYAHIFHCEYNN